MNFLKKLNLLCFDNVFMIYILFSSCTFSIISISFLQFSILKFPSIIKDSIFFSISDLSFFFGIFVIENSSVGFFFFSSFFFSSIFFSVFFSTSFLIVSFVGFVISLLFVVVVVVVFIVFVGICTFAFKGKIIGFGATAKRGRKLGFGVGKGFF